MADAKLPLRLGNRKFLKARSASLRNAGRLQLSDQAIRAAAEANRAGNLLTLLLKQAVSELRFRLLARASIRTQLNDKACDAYSRMPAELFAGINARQMWSNWRTIPRNLSGRLPNDGVKMIDLCCGTGDSTQVLAYYAPAGSEILGLEYNPSFVACARKRPFVNRHRRRVNVAFAAQSVLETFRDAAGAPVRERTVDVVNSCGAVACHFDLNATAVLAREIARVLKNDGFAMIDTGPGETRSRELIGVFEAAGFVPVHRVRSCFADRYTHVCFQKY